MLHQERLCNRQLDLITGLHGQILSALKPQTSRAFRVTARSM
jgi:hypothetical protein